MLNAGVDQALKDSIDSAVGTVAHLSTIVLAVVLTIGAKILQPGEHAISSS